MLNTYDNEMANYEVDLIDKEVICGYNKLRDYEQLIYSFYEIYSHIKYYKYNSIDEAIEYYPYYLSEEEKQDRYESLFANFENRLIQSIKVLEKYSKRIEEKELDEIISKFLEIYNKKNIIEKEKNQLYENLGQNVFPNFKKIYKKIIMYINDNLIS